MSGALLQVSTDAAPTSRMTENAESTATEAQRHFPSQDPYRPGAIQRLCVPLHLVYSRITLVALGYHTLLPNRQAADELESLTALES